MTAFGNTFDRDKQFGREVRDRILCPQLYGPRAVEGRYILVDKGAFADHLQRYAAVDTLLQGRDGLVIPIEEKIVRWPGYEYRDFAFETNSCTVPGRESIGWMHYGLAWYLLYCFMQACGRTLICYLIDFPALKEWFWRNDNYQQFPVFGPLLTHNRSMGRKVPIAVVQATVKTVRFVLEEPQAGSRAA